MGRPTVGRASTTAKVGRNPFVPPVDAVDRSSASEVPVALQILALVTIAAALWWDALPALPLLSAAFLAVNADRLWRQRGAGPTEV